MYTLTVETSYYKKSYILTCPNASLYLPIPIAVFLEKFAAACISEEM